MDLNEIKRELENERCPQCNKMAEVNLAGESFTFKVCCPVFEEHLKQRASDLFTMQMKQDLNNLFTDF